MPISKRRSTRSYTGHKYKLFAKKRKRDLERPSIDTEIGEDKKKKQRTRGGNFKLKLFSTEFVNVSDPTNKKTKKAKITRFDINAASKDLTRRKVITMGTIVETELGKVKITSRPGQHGVLNGILVQ